MESEGQLIFVYGSLKRGFQLNHLLIAQPFLGDARTVNAYRLFDLGDYPGMIDSENGPGIVGEVYRVSEECLQILDEVEGVALGMYARRRVRLTGEFADSPVHAWFWLQSVADCRDCGSCWSPSQG